MTVGVLVMKDYRLNVDPPRNSSFYARNSDVRISIVYGL